MPMENQFQEQVTLRVLQEKLFLGLELHLFQRNQLMSIEVSFAIVMEILLPGLNQSIIQVEFQLL
jgi:hypothetical protein